MSTDRIRIRLSRDTANQLDRLTEDSGLDIDTVVQLLIIASQGGEDSNKASALLHAVAQSQTQIAGAAMAAAPDIKVAAIRLGDLSESPATSALQGFDRDYKGATLSTIDPQLWRSTRGFWDMADRATALASYRLGAFLGLYCGITWTDRDPDSGRRYAKTGYRVENGRRLDPDTGSDQGPASTDENALLAALTRKMLSMPAGAQNPVANLYK